MCDVSPLILIVDDDPRSLNAMCTILSDAGYRIAAAIVIFLFFMN